MSTIRLPHGGGQTIEITELRSVFRERRVEHLTISARRVYLVDHPRHLSLDYWIRDHMQTLQNTAQATRALVRKLVETGEFEVIKAECPHSGRQVDSIKMTGHTIQPVFEQQLAEEEAKLIESTARNAADWIVGLDDVAEEFEWRWNVPSNISVILPGIEPGAATGMQSAIVLKNAIRSRLATEADSEIRSMLFMFFVRDFGGVRAGRNLEHKIAFVEELFETNGNDLPHRIGLDGISTVSKCLTLLDHQFPIFDARVGYSLNALNWLAGTRSVYLPTPKGRNSTLELIDIRTLFLIDSAKRCEDIRHCLAGDGRTANRALSTFSLDKDCVYDAYCKILLRTTELLAPGHHLSVDQVEMALFAGASTKIFGKLFDHVSQGYLLSEDG